MSSSAKNALEGTGQKKGLSKFVSRVKSRLRRDLSKRLSSSSMRSPAATSSSTIPAIEPSTITSNPAAHTAPASAPDTTAIPTKATAQRTTVELERARQLAQKYNIELEPREWKVIEVADRVEKPIRVRIHRTCHMCSNSFGSNRMCMTCDHYRCDDCPRYPKKKLPADKAREVSLPVDREGPSRVAAGIEATEGLKRKHNYVLTMPSRTGGQDLVYKKVVQRVRRNCHRCEAIFMPGNRTCTKCGHARCVNCPRDPPKQKKFPDGYPGDAFGSSDDESINSAPRVYTKPRRLARYLCHDCQAIFAHGSLKCPKCKHEKCSDCPRVLPRKIKPEHDPEVVRSVQERLKGLEMNSTDVERPPEFQLPEELVVDD